MQDMGELVAGSQLDALIYEQFFGGQPGEWYDIDDDLAPHYSTDIAAAWQLVEKIWRTRKTDDLYPHDYLRLEYSGDTWYVSLTYDAALDCGHQSETMLSEGDTAPLTICRAALQAVASSR